MPLCLVACAVHWQVAPFTSGVDSQGSGTMAGADTFRGIGLEHGYYSELAHCVRTADVGHSYGILCMADFWHCLQACCWESCMCCGAATIRLVRRFCA